ncbi:hypothetical protein [Arthrobacter sp. ISL-72]|uniref:hypothetical protein n=1 Tax=Arthrobacter sp. ISL-72 TaxID=2819114 RepID=UPI001BEA5C21|nr:hypothetical protein [Arthrobacter sp. ISL-72]MBT2597687.1 hypothetical protein [Arthrobacter sp. ISL-72]
MAAVKQATTATDLPDCGEHMPPNRATPRKHVEWNLLINTLVEIRLDGQTIRTGLVEDVMPDSSALWLAADSDNPRQIFEVCQGHQVWVTPQQLCGELSYRMTTQQIFGTTAKKF